MNCSQVCQNRSSKCVVWGAGRECTAFYQLFEQPLFLLHRMPNRFYNVLCLVRRRYVTNQLYEGADLDTSEVASTSSSQNSVARWHIQSLTHPHPFSSNQMIRNLSVKIGDWPTSPIFMLKFLIIWTVAIRDYDFYAIRAMFNLRSGS